MVTEKIILQNPERFAHPHIISESKLRKAVSEAADRLAKMAKAHPGEFPSNWATDFQYTWAENKNWVAGMYTGCYWLAYELTGDPFFRKVAESHFDSYEKRFEQKTGLMGHDVGFPYMPSCAAAYMITGEEKYRKLALDVADFFYHNAYMQKGPHKFIKRAGEPYRTMMDTLMNVTLLFWAGKETGDEKFTQAGLEQVKTTNALLIREDASSFHHYMFEVETCNPIRGLTLQGNSDDSCWTRGHAWGVYGIPVAYSYVKADFIPQLHKDISYYTLNHMPEDLVPYWDYDFTSGDEPRDTSAGLISACGMHEMAKLLPDTAEQKAIFESAAAQMVESVIDHYTGDNGIDYEGLVLDVTAAKPQGYGVAQTGVYGDFFYLEALARYLKPDFIRYW